MFGRNKIGLPTITDADGAVLMTGIPNGTYNLVMLKGDIHEITLITVKTENYLSKTITVPASKTNSIVEVKSSAPQIVVGNLNGQFSATTTDKDKGINSTDTDVLTKRWLG